MFTQRMYVPERTYCLGPIVPDNWLSASRIRHEFVNNLVILRTFAYVRGGCIILCNSQRVRKTQTRSASGDVILTRALENDIIGQLCVFIHQN